MFQFINNGVGIEHLYRALVSSICQLMDREWEVHLHYVYLEMNLIVDYLSNEAHNYEVGIHIVDHPPAECRLLLAEDVGGISLPLSVGV